MKRLAITGSILTLCLLLLAGCIQPAPDARPWLLDETATIPPEELPTQPAPAVTLPTQRPPDSPYYTPTPDQPRTLPTLRAEEDTYLVQAGDSLAIIANAYNLPLEVLLAANPLENPNALEVGQAITIPTLTPSVASSAFKIIPDSELVYGPVSSTLDILAFIAAQGGHLASYSDTVDEESLSGAEVVSRVAAEFSVNPRLLLAVLEYRSNWVTSKKGTSTSEDFPIGFVNPNYKGLYLQLAWLANQLNRGFYLYQINALAYIVLDEGKVSFLDPTLNAGTAAVQYALGQNSSPEAWRASVSEEGLYQTYSELFGIPFDLAFEDLLPADLQQPALELPFEKGSEWSFTGGPHAGWGTGSAWAALDFAPPGDEFGCFKSDAWVTAVADGVIVRSENGEVVQDLDGDGLEQTGWTILYMHVGALERVKSGTRVKTGDRIGHASCEGGITNGTHLHLARRYNGVWISADLGLPFVLSGWISAGDGEEYSGTLTKDDQVVYSWNGRVDENQIGH